jgi:hypothetical protein
MTETAGPRDSAEPPQDDPRAVWLRSLGWTQTADSRWTGPVVSTRGGRYVPMSLEHAFDVAVKRCALDHAFTVEVAGGCARLTSAWRIVPAAKAA